MYLASFLFTCTVLFYLYTAQEQQNILVLQKTIRVLHEVSIHNPTRIKIAAKPTQIIQHFR